MTWAVTAISLVVASTGVSVYGQMQAASNAKKVGEYNAKLAENQAKQTEMDAAENIRRQRIANRKALSMQMGKFAKSGVVINEGTPLELLSQSAATLELEAQDYYRNSRLQQQNLRAQGAMSLATGKMQASQYQIGAAASLLQGAGQAAAMGYKPGDGGGGGGGGAGTFQPAQPISGTSASFNF